MKIMGLKGILGFGKKKITEKGDSRRKGFKRMLGFGNTKSTEKTPEKSTEEAIEAIPGTIPARYLDPVRQILMENPVSVPTSEWIFEREVIEEFIELCSCDPFTNKFLTTNMLVPDDDLKAEIQEFKLKKDTSQGQSMQSTTKETVQTGKATDQSNSGPVNKITMLCNSKAKDLDPNFDKIPVEFLDPLEFTLMEDPVLLPSLHIVDRAVIRKHISEFHVDPFSGMYLTVDMLVPDDNLKAKIEEFSNRSMQSTTNETLETEIVSCESSSGAQNYSDPNDNTRYLYYPKRSECGFDVDFRRVNIPKEFLDPLDGELMVYPVVLPSGRRVDQLVIYEHIWDSSVDPFSGNYLATDMLVSDTDLQERINEFVSYLQMKKTVQNVTVTATYQSSPGARNDSDPNYNSEIITLDPRRGKLDDVTKNIPLEFLDPLVLRLMEDPVVLPSHARMDRAVIQSHISEFNVDPFSGRYLAVDMLVPDGHLKTRIDEFRTANGIPRSGLSLRRSVPRLSPEYPSRSDLADIPMEFLDPLEGTLMKDPVVLPSFRRVDRAVILNHILVTGVDPFSGSYLTEDMFLPDDNLKTRIEKFNCKSLQS